VVQISVNEVRDMKKVFTNGCFDVLHVGHVRYLTDARTMGDCLIVGLNSDSSVKRLKGPLRPIHTEQERKEMLLALKCIDEVHIFDEETPLRLIQEITPEVLVKGGDWPVESIVGADYVISKGGTVHSLPFHDGYSSTNTIQKIVESYGKNEE
jgi:rfaE bifunctional protein nucleotidyltransferase chain/domain